jgi:myo-inositol-1(or 4)-monophosphatase
MSAQAQETALACSEAVTAVLTEYRPQLVAAALDSERLSIPNARHDDNFLSRFDVELHDRYRAMLTKSLGNLIYVSEEGDPEVIGHDPDLVAIVDPLDTSELAVRAINGYTHLLIYSRSQCAPVAAAIGDFFHEIHLYTAARAGEQTAAHLHTRAGDIRPIKIRATPAAGRLLVTNYNMRPTERFLPLAEQRDLIEGLTNGLGRDEAGNGPTGDVSRIGVDFGSIGLCHVATNATDAFVEFAKGFALWDLLPGQFILEAAGGVVCGLDGHSLPWPTDAFNDAQSMRQALATRQKFVAANSIELAHAIAQLIR